MTQVKPRHGANAELCRAMCNRDTGVSLREFADAIDRKLNIASTYLINIVKTGEAVQAGVHGKYRYFIDREKAKEYDKQALIDREVQLKASAQRRRERDTRKERDKRARIRAEKGLPPYVAPKKTGPKLQVQPRKSGLVISSRQQDQERKREAKAATITWPDNVKIIKAPVSKDTRFIFTPPPGWKGEFSREWDERRAA